MAFCPVKDDEKVPVPKAGKKKYEIILGAFQYDQFVWHHVGSYDELEGKDGAYHIFKDYVNSQLKYTDEELKKVWNSGRLDIELRQGTKLLNWVGVYARAAVMDEEDEDKEGNDKEPGDPDKKDDKKDGKKAKKDSFDEIAEDAEAEIDDAMNFNRLSLMRTKDKDGFFVVKRYENGKDAPSNPDGNGNLRSKDWKEAVMLYVKAMRKFGFSVLQKRDYGFIATKDNKKYSN